MIDETRVSSMAREYQMNPSLARKLLEQARDVPALRYGKRYKEMMGGEAGGRKNIETVPGAEEGTVTD